MRVAPMRSPKHNKKDHGIINNCMITPSSTATRKKEKKEKPFQIKSYLLEKIYNGFLKKESYSSEFKKRITTEEQARNITNILSTCASKTPKTIPNLKKLQILPKHILWSIKIKRKMQKTRDSEFKVQLKIDQEKNGKKLTVHKT
jgi:hypothetical protein